MNDRTNKQTDEQTNKQTKQTNEHTNKQTNRQTKTLFLMLPYHESGRDLCPLVKLFFRSSSNVRLFVCLFVFLFLIAIECSTILSSNVDCQYAFVSRNAMFCFVLFSAVEREKIQKILGMQTAAQNKQLLPFTSFKRCKELN
jgi:cadmium resistance protein CadD (predicted permease)